jgi:hypothetical protein
MDLLTAIKIWTTVKPIKRFRAWRERRKERQMLKGKLTYTAVAAVILPVVSGWVGFEILPADLVPFWQAAGSALALYGRWRATRS